MVASAHEEIDTTEEIKAEIVRVFGSRADEALCIAYHESRYRPDALNINSDGLASRDRGVFQLNDYWQAHISDAEAFDPAQNVAHAKDIVDAWGGWGAWTTRSDCGL